MTHPDVAYLLGEKTELERMLAETPEDAVLDRASLRSRLTVVEQAIAELDIPVEHSRAYDSRPRG